MKLKVKITKPADDQALITTQNVQTGVERTQLEIDAAKANAMTDALTAAGKLGVWLGG